MRTMLSVIILLFFLTSCGFGQERVPQHPDLASFHKKIADMEASEENYLKRTGPLTLTISSDKAVYEEGEPIMLDVATSNNSDQQIVLFWNHLKPSVSMEKIGLTIVAIDGSLPFSASVRTVKLEAKGSAKENVWIVRPALPVGRHQIKLSYGCSNIPQGYGLDGQELWQVAAVSNTITIEIVNRQEQKLSLSSCQQNEDCKAVRNFCTCQDECVNRQSELENCPADTSSCTFNYDTQVCYCQAGQCVAGPKE